ARRSERGTLWNMPCRSWTFSMMSLMMKTSHALPPSPLGGEGRNPGQALHAALAARFVQDVGQQPHRRRTRRQLTSAQAAGRRLGNLLAQGADGTLGRLDRLVPLAALQVIVTRQVEHSALAVVKGHDQGVLP